MTDHTDNFVYGSTTTWHIQYWKTGASLNDFGLGVKTNEDDADETLREFATKRNWKTGEIDRVLVFDNNGDPIEYDSTAVNALIS